jgi:hypothetical protein
MDEEKAMKKQCKNSGVPSVLLRRVIKHDDEKVDGVWCCGWQALSPRSWCGGRC